jgi:hypothetical protein
MNQAVMSLPSEHKSTLESQISRVGTDVSLSFVVINCTSQGSSPIIVTSRQPEMRSGLISYRADTVAKTTLTHSLTHSAFHTDTRAKPWGNRYRSNPSASPLTPSPRVYSLHPTSGVSFSLQERW